MTYPKSTDDSSHHIQYLRVPRSWNVPAVISEDGVQQRWHEVGVDSVQVLSFLDVGFHELENLFLHRS